MTPAMAGSMAFLHPHILWALLLLPAIWILLRVVPPAPRLVHFPPARFFADIAPPPHTAAHTPWWVLLLRLLIAALLIFALARPVINPAQPLGGSGAAYIIIDNGWAAAQTWRAQISKAEELIAQGEQSGRSLYLIPAAAATRQEEPSALTPAQAREKLRSIQPQPFPANADFTQIGAGDVYWLGTGILDDAARDFIAAHEAATIFGPDETRLPVILRPAADTQADALLETPAGIAADIPLSVQAKDSTGSVIAAFDITTRDDKHIFPVTFDLPPALHGDIAQISLAARQGAGAVVLRPPGDAKKSVFILTGKTEETPFVDGLFYLRRAMEPFAHLASGTFDDFTAEKPAVLIIGGDATLAPDQKDALRAWVEGGGLLLRFADLNGTADDNNLAPVPLRHSGRAMEGAMTWETPQPFADFTEESPYHSIAVDKAIVVRRQVLAEPVADISEHTWASLADGTPIITGTARGRGLSVMIHTSPGVDGSDLPLSGMFVRILQETIRLAGQSPAARPAGGMLTPYQIFDGWGRLAPPPAQARPVSTQDVAAMTPDETHPPGLYGTRDAAMALNLGANLPELAGYETLPPGTSIQNYGTARQNDLRPALFLTAAALFFMDWALMLLLQSEIMFLRLRSGTLAVAALLCLMPHTASAQAPSGPQTELFLAYIKISPAQDEISRTGLSMLAQTLASRTSAEAAGVSGLSPEDKNLPLYPLLYWPVTAQAQSLSPAARNNVQAYIDRGGMILFDTMGGGMQSGLAALTQGLSLPPLARMPKEHVLSRSFYLVEPEPIYGAIWTAQDDPQTKDEVSSILITDAALARRWAAAGGSGIATRAQEIDMRFGINIAMYALTGNYKADQVHLPVILERLGQ